MHIANGVCYCVLSDFPRYRVGNDGSYWSRPAADVVQGDVPYSRWRRRKTIQDANGYAVARLYRKGRSYYRRIHKLVLETFVSPRPPGLQALHRDKDKTNNQFRNLMWGSPPRRSTPQPESPGR